MNSPGQRRHSDQPRDAKAYLFFLVIFTLARKEQKKPKNSVSGGIYVKREQAATAELTSFNKKLFVIQNGPDKLLFLEICVPGNTRSPYQG